MADDGTMWFPAPAPDGKRTGDFRIGLEKERMFRSHPTRVRGSSAKAWVTASGGIGVSKVMIPTRVTKGKIGLPGERGQPAAPTGPRPYDVVLHFIEPENAKPGERVFSVSLQGREAIKNLDVAAAAGGPWRALVREIPKVMVDDALTVELCPSGKLPPVLCGVELRESTGAHGTDPAPE
jgi:hypothetical protein